MHLGLMKFTGGSRGRIGEARSKVHSSMGEQFEVAATIDC